MLINELRLQNLQNINNVKTNVSSNNQINKTNCKDSPFAKQLAEKLNNNKSVEFSKHAKERIDSRGIDMNQADMLERLNRGVAIAQQKGSDETLVLVDNTAFVVNVKNNKVITTMGKSDMIGNIFTNIDSTVIM